MSSIILAGDIGGTKSSFALFESSASGLSLLQSETVATKEANDLTQLIKHFLQQTEQPQIDSACLGIAGPVINGVATATNIDWQVSEEELQSTFVWPSITLANDLVAMASSIPFLKSEQLHPLTGQNPKASGNIGLLAAGTGLGEALLIEHHEQYIPCASEGGHKDFAPRNELEFELHQYINALYGHASVERVLSGHGLIDIYHFFREKEGIPEPEWLADKLTRQDPAAVISKAALDHQDLLCQKSLALFAGLYGAEAGNVALQAMTTGGLYIGGGIAPKIIESLESHFIPSFIEKGRMNHILEQIPVFIILDTNAALWGAAAIAASKLSSTH